MCQDLNITHSVKEQMWHPIESCTKCELLFHHFICVSEMETSIFYSVRDLTIKNVEKVATNVVCWALSQQAKIPTVLLQMHVMMRQPLGMFVSNWTPIDSFSAPKKWELKDSMPCNHDAARNLLGICWVHTVLLLKPGCSTRRHRQPQVRRGWKQEREKENRQKAGKGCYSGCISKCLLPPSLNASWVRMQPFSNVKGRAKDTLCSKKVQRFRWW